MNKKKEFKKILKNIKEIKIQGANNIAKAALKAYFLIPKKSSKKKLLFIRPTEPLLQNVLKKVNKLSKKEILNHFKEAQEKINKITFKLIKNNSIIFTHCHSSTVINALIFAKKNKKRFEVYNTETRPLYQGRITSRELAKAKIKNIMFIDSEIGLIFSGEQGIKKPDLVLLGADALLKTGVVNKVGSELIARIAQREKIPVYILADSWKYTSKPVKMEKRSFKEVWKNKKPKIKIHNSAFEFIDKKYITGIITEFGKMTYNEFLKKINH